MRALDASRTSRLCSKVDSAPQRQAPAALLLSARAHRHHEPLKRCLDHVEASVSGRRHGSFVCRAADTESAAQLSGEGQVLQALEAIIDPDFGMSIVECGFVKDLDVNAATGVVEFRLELTTPACPVKDQFERDALAAVRALPWVTDVKLTMDAQPPQPLVPEEARPHGLRSVKHLIAVSSCKGGVGKSTTAVNLAYTLAQMGAKVGIFDADVYGPSLPTMISPDVRVLQMDPETKALTPVDYLGVKCVSFGFAGQGSAIMRGPMVSGLIQQLLLSAEWGALDYLVVDFPPGTGDIQLTLCQNVQFDAAVVVTTPQKLAFIDVAKGIRMFAKMAVPCVAVVENMAYFDADGKRHYPFGQGSGQRIQDDFGLPNLVQFPITEQLSVAGDTGAPLVVTEPTGQVAKCFSELAAATVQEIAKLRAQRKNSVRFDRELGAFVVRLPSVATSVNGAALATDEVEEFLLHPAEVRRNDTSARSVNEWTGERMLQDDDISDDVRPQEVAPLGNYAVQITWEDGFNQVAPFELLQRLERMGAEAARAAALERQVRSVDAPEPEFADV